MRPEVGPAPRAIARIAAAQHGVVARRQLRELGLRDGAVNRLIAAGWLLPLHRGVFAVGHGRLTVRGDWLAAILACGPHALLSHGPGACLHGITRSRRTRPIHVSVMRGHHGQRPGIRIHRPRRLHPDDRAEVAGIPVRSVARTLLDIAAGVDRQQLAKAFEEADRLGILRYAALTQLRERTHGHRGLGRFAHAIENHVWPDPRTRTELEHAFARFCREHGIPLPHFNVVIGPYTVDGLWPQHRLIVELDSLAGHGWLAAVEADRVRDADLQLRGYRVVRISWRRLHGEPQAVADLLRKLPCAPATSTTG